jgi:drug/metabolite transporter (DMT)-like permease
VTQEVVLGVILLGEDPSLLQLAGVAFIIAALLSIASRRRAPA